MENIEKNIKKLCKLINILKYLEIIVLILFSFYVLYSKWVIMVLSQKIFVVSLAIIAHILLIISKLLSDKRI